MKIVRWDEIGMALGWRARYRGAMAASHNSPAIPKPKVRTSPGGMIFGHVILLVFCVGLPVLFTAAAPLAQIQLSREGGKVNAEVSKRLLFVIPYSHTTLRDVQSVGDRKVAGSVERHWHSEGKRTTTRTEDSAFLELEGGDGKAKVEVSPVNIESVTQRVNAFLDDTSQPALRMTVVANWKFGVIAGGLLSLLTVLYVYLQISGLVRWAMKRRP